MYSLPPLSLSPPPDQHGKQNTHVTVICVGVAVVPGRGRWHVQRVVPRSKRICRTVPRRAGTIKKVGGERERERGSPAVTDDDIPELKLARPPAGAHPPTRPPRPPPAQSPLQSGKSHTARRSKALSPTQRREREREREGGGGGGGGGGMGSLEVCDAVTRRKHRIKPARGVAGHEHRAARHLIRRVPCRVLRPRGSGTGNGTQ